MDNELDAAEKAYADEVEMWNLAGMQIDRIRIDVRTIPASVKALREILITKEVCTESEIEAAFKRVMTADLKEIREQYIANKSMQIALPPGIEH